MSSLISIFLYFMSLIRSFIGIVFIRHIIELSLNSSTTVSSLDSRICVLNWSMSIQYAGSIGSAPYLSTKSSDVPLGSSSFSFFILLYSSSVFAIFIASTGQAFSHFSQLMHLELLIPMVLFSSSQ